MKVELVLKSSICMMSIVLTAQHINEHQLINFSQVQMISNHILVDSIEPQSNVVKHSLHTTDTIVRSKLFQSANIFALDRLYPISCLIVSLLFFVLLNIVLTMWIVVSLNFHKVSQEIIGLGNFRSYFVGWNCFETNQARKIKHQIPH